MSAVDPLADTHRFDGVECLRNDGRRRCENNEVRDRTGSRNAAKGARLKLIVGRI